MKQAMLYVRSRVCLGCGTWQEVAADRMEQAANLMRLHQADYALELLDLIGESGPVDGDALRARLRSALEGVQIHRCGKADMGPGGELP